MRPGQQADQPYGNVKLFHFNLPEIVEV